MKKRSIALFSSFLLLILFATIFFFIFSAKNKKFSQSGNYKTTLSLALREGTYADVIKRCLVNFEKLYNVKCEVSEFSEDELHKVLSGNDSSNFDFCMVDGSWMAEFTAKNLLTNLSALGYELDDDIIPATKKICYYKDNVYLAPYYGNVTVLLYNKVMVQEAGYTSEEINSLEDILKISELQKARHNLGFMYRGDSANNIVVDFLPILLSRGSYVVDENNKPTVNTQEFIEAMHFYLKLIKTGKKAKKNDLVAAIANKSAVFGIGWPGWYTPTRNSSLDYIALSGKFRDDGKSFNSNIYGIWTVGIPEKSKNKETALNLLSYLMDKTVQKNTVAYGGVPCRYSSLSDQEILKKFPQYEAVRKALESGVYRPVMEEWGEFYRILAREMNLIINEGKNIPESLEKAQADIEIMLANSARTLQ